MRRISVTRAALVVEISGLLLTGCAAGSSRQVPEDAKLLFRGKPTSVKGNIAAPGEKSGTLFLTDETTGELVNAIYVSKESAGRSGEVLSAQMNPGHMYSIYFLAEGGAATQPSE
jgi:hypothetical protein